MTVVFECDISSVREHENFFAVCLLEAPEFPGEAPVMHGVKKLAVIAATDEGGEWSWCTLSKDEKDCIGEALLKDGVGVGEWRWCGLYIVTKENDG